MANYLNDLTKGLVTGLQGIAGGFVEKGWRDNAEELFKQGQNYLTQMGLQQQNYIKQGEEILKSVDPSQQVEVGNRQTTEVGGDPTGQVQQIQGKEVNPNTIQSNPVQNSVNQSVRTQKEVGLGDLYKVIADLSNNPYGKGYAMTLEGMYKEQQPPEWKYDNGIAYRIHKNGEVETKEVTPEQFEEDLKTNEEDYFKEVDPTTGEEKYYKSYVVTVKGKRSGKMTTRQEKVEIDKDTYDRKTFTQEDAINLRNSLKIGSRGSGRRGYSPKGKSTPEQNALDNLMKQYYEVYSGSDVTRDADLKTIENAILQMGFDPSTELANYKSGNFNAKEKTQEMYDIQEAYNDAYDDIGMEGWWDDLDSAGSIDDLKAKVGWYENYLQKEVFPQVSPEIGRKLWSELQRAYANVAKYKGF